MTGCPDSWRTQCPQLRLCPPSLRQTTCLDLLLHEEHEDPPGDSGAPHQHWVGLGTLDPGVTRQENRQPRSQALPFPGCATLGKLSLLRASVSPSVK